MPSEIAPRDINPNGSAMTENGMMDVVKSTFHFPFQDGLLKHTEIYMMAPLTEECPRCKIKDIDDPIATIDGYVFQTNHGTIIACNKCNKFVKLLGEGDEKENE